MRVLRIAMDGVTGHLGQKQHLINSILAIRAEGGLRLTNGELLMPEPVLLGRNPEKLAALAAAHGGLAWSTDTAVLLADPTIEIYFDVALTAGRVERAKRAIAAGKHIYLEKPVADRLEDALALAQLADAAGVKHGVVQDKLFLPGLLKLRRLRDSGFFGEILSAKLEFGWWVFDGFFSAAQRSGWNYRKSGGGGLVLDMFPHWRYILDNLVGEIRAVSCRVKTATPRRKDEYGEAFHVDVEDEVFATFELQSGALVQVSSSWATRVRRDDLLTIQVDGTQGSAVTGLHNCYAQAMAVTPKPLWNVETPQPSPANAGWQEVPVLDVFKNSYRCGWELFLKHVAEDGPFPSPLLAGARGVQLVEACYESASTRRWVDLPPLG